ncbi:MAG: antibiotic biosynthesis monooxygenase [Rhodobacteraceae bacterium]|jgi:quinol monooxygenase YgiN|nr:antibiotic biosynthesis monooxygenase [Paracoccaceae bacterium]
MPKITVTGYLRARPEDRALIKRLLPEHIRLSRAEPGCLKFDVVASPTVADAWELDEAFVDRAAFEAHQACTRASAWGRETAHILRDVTVAEAD